MELGRENFRSPHFLRFAGKAFPMSQYLSIDPRELEARKMHGYLLGSVTPRPIAFASTIDRDGVPNLAPFSYFNVFSTRPPILVFAPNRSGITGQQKDTALNAMDTFEVVINLVNWDIVQQMNLASGDFPRSVNEFEKSGLTPLASERVKPFRVAESPVQFECRVREVLIVGGEGQSGNLIVCEVLLMHVNRAVLNDAGQIDPLKLDVVARMGGNWYLRTTSEGLFERPKPPSGIIGWDALPDGLRRSSVLTGNEIAKLAHAESLPAGAEVQAFRQREAGGLLAGLASVEDHHRKTRELLSENRSEEALLVALAAEA